MTALKEVQNLLLKFLELRWFALRENTPLNLNMKVQKYISSTPLLCDSAPLREVNIAATSSR
ncbi:hypothetical protein NIES3585_31760 [Nodularia sp. NIES-3585]|nr:hypothetical protein NIES3585_31760 [Nodularia sp. NIES-3585]